MSGHDYRRIFGDHVAARRNLVDRGHHAVQRGAAVAACRARLKFVAPIDVNAHLRALAAFRIDREDLRLRGDIGLAEELDARLEGDVELAGCTGWRCSPQSDWREMSVISASHDTRSGST